MIHQKSNKINCDFFKRDALVVAKDLIGCFLVHDFGDCKLIGRVVETEAYLSNDPACHASRGITKRNQAMFEEGGICYVYFTYGMHHCFNVVTGKKGVGEAVLIRAVQPIDGLSIMKQNRCRENIFDLCSGPAKFVEAFGITKDDNFLKLSESKIYFLNKMGAPDIFQTTRIGISVGTKLLYRFYEKGNKYISKK